jgi:hypothetical protein
MSPGGEITTPGVRAVTLWQQSNPYPILAVPNWPLRVHEGHSHSNQKFSEADSLNRERSTEFPSCDHCGSSEGCR